MVEKNVKAVKGILIKCHGKYYYKTDKEKGVKDYNEQLRAPSLEFFRETASKYMGTDDDGKQVFQERSFINIRGQLKKRLLPALLSRKITDFARVKFVVVDEITSETNEALDLPIVLRSKRQLTELINDRKMPIDADDYLEIDDLRSDILEYTEDPDTFLKNKGRKDKRRSEERMFIEMNSLNDPLPPVRKPGAGILDL